MLIFGLLWKIIIIVRSFIFCRLFWVVKCKRIIVLRVFGSMGMMGRIILNFVLICWIGK